MSCELVLANKIPGFHNYTSYEKIEAKEKCTDFELLPITGEKINELTETNLSENNYSISTLPKRDLPLVSEFGEIKSPYELIYARLEGLQYLSKTI